MMETRNTKGASLGLLESRGYAPNVVIDVGACRGTPELQSRFSKAHHILIDPVAENEPHIRRICENMSSAQYIMTAISDAEGECVLRVNPDRMLASVQEAGSVDNDLVRKVPTTSLNDLKRRLRLSGPFLVKIDTDGHEFAVLSGAADLLGQNDVYVVESTFITVSPTFPLICEFFNRNGFVVYDIVDPLYRPRDGALWQVDLVFVHKDFHLRRKGSYHECAI